MAEDHLRGKLGNYFINELEELRFLRSINNSYGLLQGAESSFSISPHSPSYCQHRSRSPRPRSRQRQTEITLTVDPPPATTNGAMPTINHDSRPDIAAWPAPPPTANECLSAVASKSSQPNQQQQLQAEHYQSGRFHHHSSPSPHRFNSSATNNTTNGCTTPTPSTLSVSATSGGRHSPYHHAKSLSPAASSIAAAASAAVAAVAAAGSSPYASPQPSPIPGGSYGYQQLTIHQQHSRQGSSSNSKNNSCSGMMNNFCEDSTKLLSMLKAVAATSPVSQGRESELRQKIQALEETVAEYERQKYNVMGTFTEYRERVAERERKLEAEYSNKIIALSEEVLGAKKDFETRMKSFQALQEQFEREKEQALEKLRQEHQKEIQVLEQRFSESQLLNLEQKYIIEIQRLEEERKSLKMEKERLGETFEVKLRRAQSLYETELTAAKMLYTRELQALREHEEALKEELAARQDEFHDRLQEIQHQAKVSRDEMNNCKNEVAQLERKLRKKETEVQDISKELSTNRNETNAALKRLNEANRDLSEMRREYDAEKAELLRKSKLLNAAEAAHAKLAATIGELQTEVKTLRSKVDFLEMERDNLQGQSDSQSHLHNSQVQALEAVLESVTKEKETTKEHYEKLLEQERELAEEREYSIKKEFSAKLNELEDQYNALREHIEQSDSFGPENVKLWEEIECLRSEKSSLEDEVCVLRNQLTQKQNFEAGDLSLDNIIELLKAIDIVKRKVQRYTASSSSRNSSSRASQVSDDLSSTIATLRGGNASLSLAEESVVSLDEPVQDDSEKVECGKGNDDDGETIDLVQPQRQHAQQSSDLKAILKRIQDLERSVDELIAEKNDACTKVEQLGEENRALVDKLEHVKALNAANQLLDAGASSIESAELQKALQDYRLRVAELERETVAAKAFYEEQLVKKCAETERNLLDKFVDERNMLSTEIDQLKAQLCKQEMNNTTAIEELRAEISSLSKEKRGLEIAYEEKSKEFLLFKQSTEDDKRKREEELALAIEQKIGNLNKEHEKTIDFIRQHESELRAELKELRARLSERKKESKPEQCEIETQTCFEERETKSSEGNEVEELRRKMRQLRSDIEKKDQLIAELRERIAQDKEEEDRSEEKSQYDTASSAEDNSSSPSGREDDTPAEVEYGNTGVTKDAMSPSSPPDNDHSWGVRQALPPPEKVRKDRSQSMGSSFEHMAVCQKAASRFRSLVSQMNQDKRERTSGVGKEGAKSSKLYYKYKSTASSSGGGGSWVPTTTTTTTRTKSPNLLTQLRANSPLAKPKYDELLSTEMPNSVGVGGPSSSTSSSKALLSPSEVEIRRRISPSRQIFFNKNGAEKRPAWKF